MRLSLFNMFMRLAYAMAIVFVATVLLTGLSYYFLPLVERPHSDMHGQLKPGGVWGHGLGVVGSAMILLLLLYSARKRAALGIRFGKLRRWLDIHIFFGVIGPMLITLHTAMKFHGIVSISYFSMLAVALSGVFGRYVYMQIPRDARGHELGLDNTRKRIDEIQKSLVDRFKASPETIRAIEDFAAVHSSGGGSRIGILLGSLGQDLTIKRRARKLKRALSRGGQKLPKGMLEEMVAMARESHLLRRRIAYLDSMSEMFHYWHVFHKPFAYIMLFIMVVHVGITVAFGYRWIF